MLIHLALLLAHLARGQSGAKVGTKRQRERGKVVLDCPYCQHVGIAVQHVFEENTRSERGSVWMVIRDTFQCGGCTRHMNTEAFTNDGTGVMKARTWVCHACKAVNPATETYCGTCNGSV